MVATIELELPPLWQASGARIPKLVNDRIQRSFEQYDEANPDVWRLFVKFSNDAYLAGQRMGAKAIIERIRWECRVELRLKTKFKINNNHVSRYVRKLIAMDPRFNGFFETRRLAVQRKAG